MSKKTYILFILVFFSVLCYGQSNFTKGEELFMHNNPSQAAPFLERAMAEDPAHTLTYVYLGIVYEQLGKADEAIAVYRRILPQASNLSAHVANNLGNVYFKRGITDQAESFYSQAIGFDSSYAPAFLGRANSRIKSGNLLSAVTDYEQYLLLDPASSQRTKIEQMIGLVRSEIAAAEMRKLLAEEEERRIAEERKKLLDSVSASLQSAAEASKGLSTGSESVEQYEDGEFILD
ncbi:MAG: tetratricopeptide repeat protein [Treponema sp.]|nr:tetratricopeptide repeat protein [Treponema sp.]